MSFSRQIDQFLEVAKQGSYIRAAEVMSVTSSALSHGVNELENRIGKKLLERRKMGVILTSYGRRFYEEISPLYEKANFVIDKYITGNTICNTVIMTDGFYYPELSLRIEPLITYSYGDIAIHSMPGISAHKSIINNDCDIAIYSVYGLKNWVPDDVYQLSLPITKLGLVMSNEMYLKYQNVEKILSKNAIIQCSSTLAHQAFQTIIENFEQYSIKPMIIGLPDIADVCNAVINELGVSLMAESMMQHPLFTRGGVRFISNPFLFPVYINRYAIFKKDRYDELIKIAMCIRS